VFVDPSYDTLGNLLRYFAHAMQEHVSITQQDAVVMMVGMAYFPEHLTIPVRFQDHAAFEGKATEKALFWSTPVVKQRPALCEIAGQAGRVGHVPGVGDLALKVDEIHASVFHEMRGKQSKSRRGAL